MGYSRAQKHKMIIRREHFNDLTAAYEILCDEPDTDVLGQIYDKHHKNHLHGEIVFWKKEEAKHIHMGDLCFEPGLYVKKVRDKLKIRLDGITNRGELVLKYGYDTKFASHLIRLLQEGLYLLREGELKFPLKEAKFLLNIKDGNLSLKEVLELSDQLEAEYELAERMSDLPDKPDYNKIESFVISNLREFLG